MNNEGKILESAVKLSDLTAEKTAAKSGMSKTQLYRLFKREVIDEYNKKCLLKAGIDLSELVRKSQNVPNQAESKMYVDDLVPEITRIKEQLKLIQDEYEFLREQQKELKEKMLETLKQELKKDKTTKKLKA